MTGAKGNHIIQFHLRNLNCAFCASRIEEALRELPEVTALAFSVGTQKLQMTSTLDAKTLLPMVQHICDTIEEGVIVEDANAIKGEKEDQSNHAHEHGNGKNIFAIGEIVIGLMALIGIELFSLVPPPYDVYTYIVLYIIMGRGVLWRAGRNLFQGKVFDENFLMSIATLGALAIQEYPEALGVMLFYRVGMMCEDLATEKSRREIMATVDLRPETVLLVKGEAQVVVPAGEVAVGDIVLIRAGDRVPLDGTVVEGESYIDTSPVTGEPVPVAARPGVAILSGCLNESGLLKMRVDYILQESMVTKILHAVENAAANKPVIDRFITRFARYYTPAVVGAALTIAIIPSLLTGEWHRWIYTALTFLVISCPCAIVLTVPLSFFAGIGAGSKKGILYKGGRSIEALRRVAVVALDKTGTVTEGNFTVQEIQTVDNITSRDLLQWVSSLEALSTHPVGVSIFEAAHREGITTLPVEESKEIAGKGMYGVVDGKAIVCGNVTMLQTFSVTVPADALSTVGGTVVYVGVDGVYGGKIIVSDTLKEDAKASIKNLRDKGYTLAMLSGDTEESAKYVAQEAGIDIVMGSLLPQDKVAKLQQLREQYGPVLFVGDGLNDAPVLAGADASAAMGSGAHAAIDAADAVFMNSDVQSIPNALALAHKTVRVAYENIVFALGFKVCVMILGVIGYASMWMAVFADTGVMLLCVLNAIRILYAK